MSTVISSNRLDDGSVAYLDVSGNWTADLAAARVLSSKEEEEAGLAQARLAIDANFIVDPLIVPIKETPEGRRAVTLRDIIRAAGPTVDYATSTEAARS
jgi:hypothetical protein